MVALAALAAGCGRFGTVNQGRVVALDEAARSVTLVDETGVLRSVRLPADPREMGPVPEPGGLMRLDRARGVAVWYAGVVNETPVRFCAPGEPGAVAVRDGGDVVAFIPPAAYRNLPAATWKFGDEIRYYYKDPGQALRMMNVTRTDLARSR